MGAAALPAPPSVSPLLMNRNVFIEKRHSARVSYSLSTICLLQLKCLLQLISLHHSYNRNLYIAMLYACAELFRVLTNVNNKCLGDFR